MLKFLYHRRCTTIVANPQRSGRKRSLSWLDIDQHTSTLNLGDEIVLPFFLPDIFRCRRNLECGTIHRKNLGCRGRDRVVLDNAWNSTKKHCCQTSLLEYSSVHYCRFVCFKCISCPQNETNRKIKESCKQAQSNAINLQPEISCFFV